MAMNLEKAITGIAEQTRIQFRALLDKTNNEHPSPKDVKALSCLLSGNRKLELWSDVLSAGHLAEIMVIENARAAAGLKECWKHRLQVLKEGSRLRGRAVTGETSDPASCLALAET